MKAKHFLDADDGIEWEYETEVWPTLEEAQRQACLEYLCMLLGHEPERVGLPPMCFSHWYPCIGCVAMDFLEKNLPNGGLFNFLWRHSGTFDQEDLVYCSRRFCSCQQRRGLQTSAPHQPVPVTHAAPRAAEDGVITPATQQPITATPGALRTAAERVQPLLPQQLSQASVMDLRK